MLERQPEQDEDVLVTVALGQRQGVPETDVAEFSIPSASGPQPVLGQLDPAAPTELSSPALEVHHPSSPSADHELMSDPPPFT